MATTWLAGAGLALLSLSCLTPPAARGVKVPGAAAKPKTMATAAPSLGDFTRSSAELLAQLRYYMEYVTKAAVERGLVPVYWDNGGRGSGADSFALVDREANGVFRPKLMAAILRAVTSAYALKDVAPPVPEK